MLVNLLLGSELRVAFFEYEFLGHGVEGYGWACEDADGDRGLEGGVDGDEEVAGYSGIEGCWEASYATSSSGEHVCVNFGDE